MEFLSSDVAFYFSGDAGDGSTAGFSSPPANRNNPASFASPVLIPPIMPNVAAWHSFTRGRQTTMLDPKM